MRRAFTLIELLVVILVMAILAGLVLTGVGAARESVRRARTGTILAAVRLGLETFQAERLGLPAAAPHPAANTDGTRLAFQRSAAATGFTAGAPVATTGEALLAPDVATVVSGARTRLVLDSDVFADPQLPAFEGVPRRSLRILGSGAGLVRVRRLPALTAQFDRFPKDGILDHSGGDPFYSHVNYNDNLFLDFSGGTRSQIDVQSEQVLRSALGQSVMDELFSIGAFFSATSGQTALDERFRTGVPDDRRFAANTLSDGTAYALRGMAIYDAWGREVLYETGADGTSFQLVSAGSDGLYGSGSVDGLRDNITDGRRQE